MDWIKIKDRNHAAQELPKDRIFLALWKGSFCIAEWDKEEQRFYIGMMPCIMIGMMRIEPEREIKFTHWCELKLPEDYTIS